MDTNIDKLFLNDLLGEKIKEGLIFAQRNEEWVRCYVGVREYGVTFSFLSESKNNHIIQRKDDSAYFMKFMGTDDVEIEMMPDHARRSRESKLFPFALRGKIYTMSNTKKCLTDMNENLSTDEIILATMEGRTMWEWASAIKWRGTPPKEERIPLFREASIIRHHNKHYDCPNVLQEVILKLFTYKNLPKKPVTFEAFAIQKNRCLRFVYYPEGFLSRSFENWSSETDFEIKENDNNDIENPEYIFGLFAYLVLVGACVKVNEKCFELIIATNLYDLSSQVNWKGNSPLSMLCEGDYSTSRIYMVKALWDLGYPKKLSGYHAGFCDRSFSQLLAKPPHMWGSANLLGQPVHLDDQKLCYLLQQNGDGSNENKFLSNEFVEASENEITCFKSDIEKIQMVTAFKIPQSVMKWGCTVLKTLSLSGSGIFKVPDELYEFANLTDLDLSRNCLFGLSHKLGNLKKLQRFFINSNLIPELPDTIEALKQINEFDCSNNPITKPPSAVWKRGIESVRNFFKDMRESGTEKNFDLKVLVLGLSEAGKTSLINGLIQPNMQALTRVGDRTVGIEQRTWIMRGNDNRHIANLLIHDFAGQEEYYITHHLFLGSKALYILAFDLSKYENELLDKQILLWWNSIQNRVSDIKSSDSKTPKVIIVGTHADMVDCAQKVADQIHKKLKKLLMSRADDENRRIELLELELTALCPNRKREKYHEEKEFQKLPAIVRIKIKALESEIDKIRHQQQCAIALPPRIYAVSSKDLSNFDKLREGISSSLTEIGPSGKYFPQLHEELPISWFRVRKFVREQSAQKGRGCMKLTQYFKLLSDELGICENVGLRASYFCHDLGDVLFFEKEGLVFLRPSLLIDAFKLVIRHDHKESTHWKEELLNFGIDEKKFEIGKELLLQKGELEEWLLDILWLPLDTESSIKNRLIQLLETFDIATPVLYNGSKKLLIPEFQPRSINRPWFYYKDKDDFEVQRWVTTNHGGLPQGLLKRIQVRILKKIFKRNRSKNYLLAQEEFFIENNESIKLYCKSDTGIKNYPTGYKFSEGIMIYISGRRKQQVLSLLKRVHVSLVDTLRDFPGLIFDHYTVNMSNSGSLVFTDLKELRARQEAGEQHITISNTHMEGIENEGKVYNISDLVHHL